MNYYIVHQSRAAEWAVCGSRLNLRLQAESESDAVAAWEEYVSDLRTSPGCTSHLVRLLDARGEELRSRTEPAAQDSAQTYARAHKSAHNASPPRSSATG
jgi:hypothetical protein